MENLILQIFNLKYQISSDSQAKTEHTDTFSQMSDLKLAKSIKKLFKKNLLSKSLRMPVYVKKPQNFGTQEREFTGTTSESFTQMMKVEKKKIFSLNR